LEFFQRDHGTAPLNTPTFFHAQLLRTFETIFTLRKTPTFLTIICYLNYYFRFLIFQSLHFFKQ